MLQAIAFNIRIALVAVLVMMLGSVLGWLLAAVAGTRSASWTRLAAVVALAIIAVAAAISLLMA